MSPSGAGDDAGDRGNDDRRPMDGDRGPADGDRVDPGAEGDDEEEWRYSLSDLEDDEDDTVFGPTPRDGPGPVDDGHPDLENALFVVLGVAASLAVLASVLGLL